MANTQQVRMTTEELGELITMRLAKEFATDDFCCNAWLCMASEIENFYDYDDLRADQFVLCVADVMDDVPALIIASDSKRQLCELLSGTQLGSGVKTAMRKLDEADLLDAFLQL